MANLSALIGGGGFTEYLEYTWRTAPNAAGQSITANTITTVNLDTEVLDTGSKGSISTNQVTLEAGTYEFSVDIPVDNTAGSAFAVIARLYNVTDASLITSQTATFTNRSNGTSDVRNFDGVFVLASQKVIQLELVTSHSSGTVNVGVGEAFTLSTSGAQDRTRLTLKWKA